MAVLVLGDLGLSPRMQYHALSLAEERAAVELIGYRGSELPPELIAHPAVTVHRLPAPPSLDADRGRWLWLDGGRRLAAQSLLLLRLLLAGLPRPDLLLVQNPPPMPALAVAWLAARLRRARLVVDWHNFGHAMLALKLGRRHPAVRLVAGHERRWGRRADGHLTVSRAMSAELKRWGIDARVLYDRPPQRFRPTPAADRHRLFRRLAAALDLPPGIGGSAGDQTATPFTE
ncbi:MAG: hypothetical protein D6696_00340, partial [Acidobacteria bacterium]